ncbi:MAG: glutamine amidotransferase [Acidobacteriota bacterium]|nr:glutamine amidotransferase [Acidobacteriota bacterium]
MLKIALLYPELLGTYGDGGNAVVLAERARRRGIEARTVTISMADPLEAADIYLLGGGEDGPQRQARDLLAAGSLGSRVADGAGVLAVCAGLQILGDTFAVEGDDAYDGLGLVAMTTVRGTRRSVGEIAVEVGGHTLVGFENHGGRTKLARGVAPLGAVQRGQGNDGMSDGFRAPRLWGTYAHGPVLALNPWFADEILADVLGAPLEPLASVADVLYEERLASVMARRAG